MVKSLKISISEGCVYIEISSMLGTIYNNIIPSLMLIIQEKTFNIEELTKVKKNFC
ncbi:hypothetical protein [Clostridium puniceum]|uniref:hypothetical protein n=1 Tax=Clostridium puniceum TaxID=29367 RepID=UPI001A9A5974|nr:hypothetical protein [Clostridium puniceum]